MNDMFHGGGGASREDRLERIRRGLPPIEDKPRRSTAIRVSGAPRPGGSGGRAGGGPASGGFEISDNAANLIAQALKTLLNS
ncbi:MAG: hypothetical protein LBU70_08300 [Chitinispirillales bacterium]|jgi:hypothetical protein|nr:hypothetical protein [Chitinispirillales bacterium]